MKGKIIILGICTLLITSVISVSGVTNNTQQSTQMKEWWPMFRHDIEHTGYTESAAPNYPVVNWSSGPGGIISTSPAVADGRVYIGGYIDACPPNGVVYCLDATDGELIWSYNIESVGGISSVVESSPAVAYGNVYVGCNDGYLYCLDAEGIGGGQTIMHWRTLVNFAQGFRRKWQSRRLRLPAHEHRSLSGDQRSAGPRRQPLPCSRSLYGCR